MKRLVVVGLDCLTPQWALEPWLDEMPHLKSLLSHGLGGRLVSPRIAQASPWALQGQLVYNSPVTVRRNPSP